MVMAEYQFYKFDESWLDFLLFVHIPKMLYAFDNLYIYHIKFRETIITQFSSTMIKDILQAACDIVRIRLSYIDSIHQSQE